MPGNGPNDEVNKQTNTRSFIILQLNKALIERYDFKYLPLSYSKILLKLHCLPCTQYSYASSRKNNNEILLLFSYASI